jgi:hypothetical protein
VVSEKIKSLLKAISDESETFKILKTDPEKLSKKFGLTKEEVEVLKKSDLLLVRQPHLGTATTRTVFAAATYTFITGSTITL